MLLESTQSLVFLGVEERVSKRTDQAYYLVVLGDDVNFENYEFFKRDELSVAGISKGDRVDTKIMLSKRGYNINTDLVEMSLSKDQKKA